MPKRGRKSAASMSVAPATVLRVIPPPPDKLTEAQAEVWRVVMARPTGEMITRDAFPLLVELCQAVDAADRIATQVNKFEPDWCGVDGGIARWTALLTLQDKIAQSIIRLCRQLRISPQARILPRSAGQMVRREGPTPWDCDPE